MLLLPFAFANVAFWTRPRTAGPGGAGQWGKRDEDPLDLGGSAAWFQRLLCLGVTATFALAAVGAGVDLVGWQCETRQCLDKLPTLGFLEVKEAGGSWWSSGTRPPLGWSSNAAPFSVTYIAAGRYSRSRRCRSSAKASGTTGQPIAVSS